MAQCDPAGFETLRADLIEDCIRHSSKRNQRRLRGLQFVIEARRRVARSPMAAVLEIQAMMYESLFGLHQALMGGSRTGNSPALTRARVLPFRRHPSPGD
ncbi:DUF3135 domain-containing protein [Marinobacter halodurans]